MPLRKLAPDKGRKKHVPREEFIYDTDGSCLRHDDTLILHPDYWGSMIATKHDAFDDPMWDEPIKQDKLTTAPGAVVFLNYCKSKGVEVFYVTSRDPQDARPPLLIKSRKKQEIILKRFIVFV